MAEDLIDVAVIFGGQSTEHEISCLTAAGVLSAIDSSKYRVHGIGIDKQGLWHRYSLDEIVALRRVGDTLPSIDETHPTARLIRTDNGVRLGTVVGDQLTDVVPIDVAFPVMHGAYCEDGTIQGYLEILGLRYVGCGVTSSVLCMDKELMHTVFDSAGIAAAPWYQVRGAEWKRDRQAVLDAINEKLTYPLFVKPARGGSSVGISRVGEPAELEAAIDEARAVDPKVLVETGIVGGREIECGVLGSGDSAPMASYPGEIIMHTGDKFYDYKAKYLPEEQVDLSVPAKLDDETQARVQEIALRCFDIFGCEGLARVDTFVRADGSVLVNEINTMPGFTSLSMYPSMWAATGVDYPTLIDTLIKLALARPATVLR